MPHLTIYLSQVLSHLLRSIRKHSPLPHFYLGENPLAASIPNLFFFSECSLEANPRHWHCFQDEDAMGALKGNSNEIQLPVAMATVHVLEYH